MLDINIGVLVQKVLRSLFYSLCSMIYNLVIGLYEIFELLCTVRVLDMDIIDALAQRIGLVLGLVMLFVVIFSLINSLINPDILTDKTKSPVNIIKKVLLVIVMFGVSSFAFNGLYYIQKTVIKSNVVAKIFVPTDDDIIDNFGNELTKEMFLSFYTINDAVEGSSEESIVKCEGIIDTLKNDILDTGNFEIGEKCLGETIEVGDNEVFVVDFSYVYALVVGCFMVYFIFSYCLSVGVRTFQLVFLEIISPMAFVGYLSPKNDNMFSKWLKIYLATYIDVFIRIGVISLVTFLISVILRNNTNYGNLVEVISGIGNGWIKTLITILLIFALLTFAKKAPDLIKDLFPGSASKLGLGISSPKKMFDSMLGGNLVRTGTRVATGGAAVGLLGAAMSGMSRYNINKSLGKGKAATFGAAAFGAATGFGRGLAAGSKKGSFYKNLSGAIKEQEGIDDKYIDLVSSGGSTLGKMKSKAVDLVSETAGQRDNRMITNMNNLAKFTSDAKAAADNMNFVKSAKDAWENAVQMENETREAFIARKETYGEQYRKLRNAAMQFAITGNKDLLNYKTVSYKTVTEEVPKRDENGMIIVGQKETKEVLKEIVNEGNYYAQMENDYDSQLAVRQIKNCVEGAKQYSESHAVQCWDENKKAFVSLNDATVKDKDGNLVAFTFDNFDHFKSLGDLAKDTEFQIISSADYSKNQANDAAAGVNDRRKIHERK